MTFHDQAVAAKVASRALATANRATKDAALHSMADALLAAEASVLAAAKSVPVWNDGAPVIGWMRGPNSLVSTHVPSGSGNTTRAEAATVPAATTVAARPGEPVPSPATPVRASRIASATGS